MADLDFGLVDSLTGLLDKHKERLGPFHRPLSILLGSAIFLLILAVLIGLPMWWIHDFNYIALVQFALVVVYFMLLLTIKQDVSDRFVFCMALFLVMTAGPVVIVTEAFLETLRAGGSVVPEVLKDPPKLEVYLYSLLRGLGNVLWALPLLFMFYTFYPSYEKSGKDRVDAWAGYAFRTALVLQSAAVVLVLWLDGAIVGIAPVPTELGALGKEIEKYQLGYLLFLGIYLVAGFATIFAARYGFKGSDKRWLCIVVLGLVACQFFYVISSYNGRQISLYYPGARTTAGFIDVYQSADTDQLAFVTRRLRNISTDQFGDYVTYAVCEGQSGQFSFKVDKQEDFNRSFQQVHGPTIRQSDPLKFFCPTVRP